MTASPLADNIRQLMQRSHKDLLSYLSLADMAAMQARQQSNMDRMNAQVDAQIRKCNPDYKPPEEGDDVAHNIFINAGLMTDQQTGNALVNALREAEGGLPLPPAPIPQQSIPPSVKKSSPIASMAKATIPLLLASGLSAGAAIAAARYFAPEDTDTTSIYGIEALPYQPPQNE